METVAPRRRFVGRKVDNAAPETQAVSRKPVRRALNQIPAEILNDQALNEAIKLLPHNYNFEIHKTVWNIRTKGATRVALQMPEGLLVYACIVADILEQFCGVEVIVMGDVTYGACCIDDFTAVSLGCDMLVHYAHSCLVPIDVTKIKVLYVFVTIGIDEDHLVKTLVKHLSGKKLALVSTIQFNYALHQILEPLRQAGIEATAPQQMPLSKGEVLGCTAPQLDQTNTDAIVYIGDGRFHLESAMIYNPNIVAYKYDPYNKEFTVEEFGHEEMRGLRMEAINQAKTSSKVGLILGALGRQGNPQTVRMMSEKFQARGVDVVVVVLSEIFPSKLAHFTDVDCWVQIACPRLSIDWGYAFPKPLLTPYEAMVMLEEDSWLPQDRYPMDYYAKKGYGRGQMPRSHACGGTCEGGKCANH